MLRKILYVCFACLFLFAFSGCSGQNAQDHLLVSRQDSSGTSASGESSRKTEIRNGIYVYICGEVRHPGVFQLPSGSRIYQLVEKAGGLTKKAAKDGINMAEELSDGQMVNIPKKVSRKAAASGKGDDSGTDPAAAQTPQDDQPSDGKVNINTASQEQLMTLSGIGETKAKSIITYRSEHGSFKKPEDLMNVSGIAEGTFSKIKNDITV